MRIFHLTVLLPAVTLVLAMKILPLLLLVGCADLTVRPVTRVEYGRNTWDPNRLSPFTVETAQVQGGIVAHATDSIALGMLAGPAVTWDDVQSHVYTGVNLNPRMFYFFEPGTFIHVEADWTLYDGAQNTYVLVAYEQEW